MMEVAEYALIILICFFVKLHMLDFVINNTFSYSPEPCPACEQFFVLVLVKKCFLLPFRVHMQSLDLHKDGFLRLFFVLQGEHLGCAIWIFLVIFSKKRRKCFSQFSIFNPFNAHMCFSYFAPVIPYWYCLNLLPTSFHHLGFRPPCLVKSF